MDPDEVLSSEQGWLEEVFEDIFPWRPKAMLKEKIVWIRCVGLLIHMWKQNCFKGLLAPFGELLALDVLTESFERLEFACLKIRSPCPGFVDESIKVILNGEQLDICFYEETSHSLEWMQGCACENKNMEDEEASSSDWSSDGDNIILFRRR